MAAEAQHAHAGPMVPIPYVVRRRARETGDTWTIELAPVAGGPIEPLPGQFAMLYADGVGEVPISLSGRGRGGSLVHTIRDVGMVTAELCRLPRGTVVGVRGPFGTPGRPSGGTASALSRSSSRVPSSTPPRQSRSSAARR